VDLSTLDDQRLTILRRDRIGFVFQAFNLVPTITAAQNITLPLLLASRPEIIFADEPTGNLDSRTSVEIMDMLTGLNAAGKTIIMVTHETDIAAVARRVIRLRDGQIESDERNRA